MMIIGVLVSSYFYYEIQGTHNDEQQTYINIALDYSPIETVEKDYAYNGEEDYTVVQGIDEDERYYTFVPKKEELNEDDVEWILEDEGITEEELISEWRKDCSNCKLLNVTPGIMNDQFIWELIYENENRMYFRTFLFETGELYDSISFNKN
ncbi:DUF5590 domain-containing protein [Alkalibacillus silvisoli]